MFISYNSLRRARPVDVIRLARFVGFADATMEYDTLIQELHIRINWG